MFYTCSIKFLLCSSKFCNSIKNKINFRIICNKQILKSQIWTGDIFILEFNILSVRISINSIQTSVVFFCICSVKCFRLVILYKSIHFTIYFTNRRASLVWSYIYICGCGWWWKMKQYSSHGWKEFKNSKWITNSSHK